VAVELKKVPHAPQGILHFARVVYAVSTAGNRWAAAPNAPYGRARSRSILGMTFQCRPDPPPPPLAGPPTYSH
jgi:hypothetical protein